MNWHALGEKDAAELTRLAGQLKLHPLHIEDCHHGGQNAKLEEEPDYLFAVLKPLQFNADGELEAGDLDIFLGRDFLVTYEESGCGPVAGLLSKLREAAEARNDQILYKLLDGVVDSYVPLLDRVSENIDAIEDEVLSRTEPDLLRRIFSLKRSLIEMRRVLTQTRDLTGHLLRLECRHVDPKLRPYFRDVYDHTTRHIESVEMSRDLLSGALDIYLSSVANRTNETMKVLALLSSIVLPSLLVTGFFGMNFTNLPWAGQPDGLLRAAVVSLGLTAALTAFLKHRRWI